MKETASVSGDTEPKMLETFIKRSKAVLMTTLHECKGKQRDIDEKRQSRTVIAEGSEDVY